MAKKTGITPTATPGRPYEPFVAKGSPPALVTPNARTVIIAAENRTVTIILEDTW